MAVLHDFQCGTCDRLFDALVDAATLPAGPPCPTCGSATERRVLPPAVRWTPNAVVVYRAPDGSFRFPGETGGASCAKYDRFGYERIEARGFAEVRRLEQRMNAHERSHMARLDERRQALREHGERLRSSELRRVMEQHMTEDGRKFARRVVELRDQIADVRKRRGLDRERPTPRLGGEPGLHVECYSNDRSNREPSVDPSRGRMQD